MKAIVLLAAVLSVFSCATNGGKSAGQQEVPDAAEQTEDVLSGFPIITISAPDGLVYSNFSTEIVESPLSEKAQALFGNALTYRFTTEYSLYNTPKTVTYYAMVFDFIPADNVDPASVKRGDVVGVQDGKPAKVLTFSRSADPYLIINCGNRPYEYDGFYWFESTFLFPTGNTNWLSFNPTEDISADLIGIADHVTSEAPGFTFYPQFRVRYKTVLTDYPRPATDKEKSTIAAYENAFYRQSGITTHVSPIKAGDYDYLLCWQSGFDGYLRDEYTLGNDIWLFGSIVTYNIWDNCGYIFLRDFKTESLEDMYEGRIQFLEQNSQ
ncbi:hypothetical protein [Breznakiella homolactica]|uniref:Uncharacterized protein n=1 Tax=Breznakiella homolactica TaxID=2798577 RepID=A0A7T7XQ17_9SPIR|nr:hypothetical protein [Breznakiella homolactica]QQO10282.1 hypothetical protein JFL75_05005 [Breznakiella homolactica]